MEISQNKSGTNIEFIMNFIADFIEGDLVRQRFDENFINFVKERFMKMKQESPKFTDDFCFYMVDCGFDSNVGLPEGPYRKRMRMRYNQLLKATNNCYGRKLKRYNGRPCYYTQSKQSKHDS